MSLAAGYPNAAVWELSQRYGEVFAFGFGSIRFHWLVGPRALSFVLALHPESFGLNGAYRFLAPIGGETALITSDEPDHLRRRRLVQPAFHGPRLAGFWARVVERNRDFSRGLPRSEAFDLYASVRPLMLGTICELLLGRDTLERHPAMLTQIEGLMAFANQPFLAQLFKLPLPGSPWGRFLEARAALDEALYREIERRQAAGLGGDDILGLLLAARDESGGRLSERELRDQALSLVSAGFDTTSAALVWAVYLLLSHRDALERLREELGRGSSPAHILKLPWLDAVFKETLRLYPAAPAGLRQALEDVTYGGYLIPKGSRIAYSIYATQRQEASFADALEFRPERWLSGPAPSPFSYLPFGYGARYCIGAQLATALVKLLLAELLQDDALEPAWREPVQETGNTVHPKGGLWVRLRVR